LQDFSQAIHPVSFFVSTLAFGHRGNVQWQDVCLDNGQTNERLVVKKIDDPHPGDQLYYQFVLISRYPMGANQEWIEANQQEIMEWKFHEQNRRIRIERSLG
jgi:hypothetical protein